jgi:hypothetical protein
MHAQVHTYIYISKISLSHDLALLLLAQKIVEKNFRLHVQVGFMSIVNKIMWEREREVKKPYKAFSISTTP